MDKYLESLVVKGEKSEEPVVAEVAEKPTVAEEAAEQSEEINIESESIEAAREAVDADVNDNSEVKDTTAEVEDVTSNLDSTTMFVASIKVFNTPDPKGLFKFFTGNIVPKGQVDTMTCIEYMKPGFGLVTGFTPDLK